MIASGNGVQTRYLYFGLDVQAGNPQFFGKLRQICVTTSNCALGAYTGTLMNLAYWYDNVGNITTLRDDTNRQKENFAYDPMDRLVSATPETIGVDDAGLRAELQLQRHRQFHHEGRGDAGLQRHPTPCRPLALEWVHVPVRCQRQYDTPRGAERDATRSPTSSSGTATTGWWW